MLLLSGTVVTSQLDIATEYTPSSKDVQLRQAATYASRRQMMPSADMELIK